LLHLRCFLTAQPSECDAMLILLRTMYRINEALRLLVKYKEAIRLRNDQYATLANNTIGRAQKIQLFNKDLSFFNQQNVQAYLIRLCKRLYFHLWPTWKPKPPKARQHQTPQTPPDREDSLSSFLPHTHTYQCIGSLKGTKPKLPPSTRHNLSISNRSTGPKLGCTCRPIHRTSQLLESSLLLQRISAGPRKPVSLERRSSQPCADWDYIRRPVQLRNCIHPNALDRPFSGCRIRCPDKECFPAWGMAYLGIQPRQAPH